MEPRAALHLARRLLSVGLRSRNWREITLSTLKGQTLSRIILRNGIEICAPDDNTLLSMVHEILLKKIYTPLFLPIEPDDIVVDIGANIGVFTLYAAKRTRNTVYAFEPFPGNAEFLRRNAERSGFSNIITRASAIGCKVGTARLYLSRISGGHRLFDHYGEIKLRTFIEVPMTTLERVIDDNSIKQIDFLKMDCEGAEGSILTSTRPEYLMRIRKIAMEFHDDATQATHDAIQGLLERTGFLTRLSWDGKSPYGYIYAKRG
ncbi:MAG: FkbM family methyltransferase [bacterium]